MHVYRAGAGPSEGSIVMRWLLAVSLAAIIGCGQTGRAGNGKTTSADYQTELMELDRLEKDLNQARQEQRAAYQRVLDTVGTPQNDLARREESELSKRRQKLGAQFEAQQKRVEQLRASRR